MAALAGLDERGTVKRLISALATASAVFAVAPAAAQPTYEYFSARAVQSSAPRQLDQQARDFYSAVFAAIDRKEVVAPIQATAEYALARSKNATWMRKEL